MRPAIPPIRLPATALAVALLASTTRADVRLHRLFTSDMVLQRDAEVPVRGWADPCRFRIFPSAIAFNSLR